MSMLDTFKKGDYSTKEYFDLFYDLVRQMKPKIILELGLGRGGSTRVFLLACKDFGGHLYTIEINPEGLLQKEAIKQIVALGLNKYWTLIEGDSTKVIWDKTIDILFIDSEHKASIVEKEIKKYFPFIKPNGIILIHDMNVKKDYSKEREEYIKKIYEIFATLPIEYEYIPGECGLIKAVKIK